MKRRRPLSKKPKMTFHIVTLFPESLDSYISSSIVGRAIEDGYIAVKTYNPRDYVDNKWHRVDQRPYGGGPGMVIEALPVIMAIADAKGRKNARIVFLTPRGRQFTNEVASEYAMAAAPKKGSKTKAITDIVFVCGRYEGIDARVREAFLMEDVSVGPFVLTGGELAALTIIDATARQIEGVLGDFDSREETRVGGDWVYTRPEAFKYKGKNYVVPTVLLSGDPKKIDQWRDRKNKGEPEPEAPKAAGKGAKKG